MSTLPHITLSKTNQIVLDYEDSVITINYKGMFDNNKWYSWSLFAPTEYNEPEYHSKIITETELLNRFLFIKNHKPFDKQFNEILNKFFENTSLKNTT